MTAIAGIGRLPDGACVDEDCARMLAAQAIYGRDASDCWNGGCASLGRGLSRLLPEDDFDLQPLIGGSGRFVLVADLRLDNRRELTTQLRVGTADAAKMSDAALLLAAFECWGLRLFDHLVGEYAFALWDQQDRTLTLARDISGFRPLHYSTGDGFWAFASMPKGLHALPEIPRAPDETRTAEFVAYFPEWGRQSFFESIRQVESGTVVTISNGRVEVRRHWEWTGARIRFSKPEDYLEGLRFHLDQAVSCRLRGSDGVIATQLSAGLDSSAVTATAARLTMASMGRILAYTAVPREGYREPWPKGRLGDEGPLAAETARMYPNIEHILIRSGGASPIASLDQDLYLCDRPLLNRANVVWNNAIYDDAAKRGIKILLIGFNGNLGMSHAGREAFAELLKGSRWLQWARLAIGAIGSRQMTWQGVVAGSIGPWLPAPVWRTLSRWYRGTTQDFTRYTMINPSRVKELDLEAKASRPDIDLSFRPHRNRTAAQIDLMRRRDPGNYMKGALGGWGIDVRDPTADRRLIEYCLSIPTEEYIRDGRPRALARSAFVDRLPRALLDNPLKGQQAVDWHEGATAARDELRREVERLEEVPSASRSLDLPRMRALIDNWPDGGWERAEIVGAYRLALLRGISVGHFLRKASGSNQ